ncbi:DUF4126 family protein [Solirubrum puertoriconensis]|uniref:DUF4126 domain-containing protein n=1 Tax=Solirubrum puertoriconensis TaxID=1751427 RepID=A0A9X0HLA1_SOLP1|nr:DUF4126 family protein [Solirubrum puertoriconensis]KUG08020.1 hypothetical protein ASU33_07385 [Solirubrum puertoriconensis]
MRINRTSVFWQTLGLGALSGLRSMSSLAMLSHVLHKQPSGRLAASPLRWFQSGTAANALKVMAGGELLGDKLPNMPDRTAPPILGGRILSGALVGGVLAKANRNSLWQGALLGAAAAVASSYAALYLRKAASRNTPVKEPWTGVVEDAITLASGTALLKGNTPGH